MTLSIPTRAQAEQILLESEAANPGPWVGHSRAAARAAEAIASAITAQLPEMDPDAAYILGLLHDIGRREGVSDMCHIIDGYRWFTSAGFTDCARISLTHSFPLKDVRTMQDNWDGTSEDMDFIGRYLDGITYTPYDHLIQLCDALSLPNGNCLIEKRMVDVALRRGINAYTLPKWRAFFDIQREFETRMGKSIYACLPGVVENTFQTLEF